MYGLVNQAVADLITERFGADAWQRVRVRAGVGEKSFVSMGSYPDAVAFPQLTPPSFWCSEVGDDRLRLHYESTRVGLAPMVIGLVRGLGAMYDTEVTVVLMERAKDATHEQCDVRFTPREPRV